MKKLLSFLFIMLGLITLASCGNEKTEIPEAQELSAPVLTVTDKTVSWEAISNAKGYVVKVNDSEKAEQTELSYTISDETPGTYNVSVKAVSSDTKKYLDSPYSSQKTITIEAKTPDIPATPDTPAEPEGPVVLSNTTVWIVGDSTVCDYAKSRDDQGNVTAVTDSTYFYDRYGYGTQIGNYLNSEKVTIKNIALSGRSSKSFILEENYTTLKNGIKSGDYLIIGFGHNDEKSDDETRFASANLSTDTVGSFKYNLYNYYCKVALDKGATPIICTPIVRATSTNDYSGSNGHITAGGNYAQAIIDLGVEKSITTIDLTTLTKNLYTKLGYDEAIYFHAMTQGLDENTPNVASADKTHINIYGAKMVSYMFANALKDTNNTLANYIDNDKLVEPTKTLDLVKNKFFVYKEYSAPDLTAWKSLIEAGVTDETTGDTDTTYYDYFKTITEGWYGTAFGDTSGSAMSKGNLFTAKEIEAGVFEVGCGMKKGKIATSSEGYAMVFKQIAADDNFEFSADVEITTAIAADMVTQGGFGLVVRDDIYVNQPKSDTSIKSNGVYAGMYTTSAGSNIVYSRETGSLTKAAGKTTVYVQGDTAKLSIERVGQVITAKVIYKEKTYTQTYTDFDLVAIDSEHIYIGMYAIRSTIAKFTNVVYNYTGKSQGA